MNDKVPDFEDMFKLAQEIGNLLTEKLSLDNNIASMEADAVSTAAKELLINGKSPSMEYIKSTVKHTGLNGEIIPLRARLAVVEGQLEASKRLFDVFQSMISIFQTESANKRATLTV